ncbi:MAG: transglutaminase-like domain-containing protein [Opitutales bacterium]
MDPTGLSPEKQDALLRLLDDDSPVVRSALLEEFGRLDRHGVTLLEAVATGHNRVAAMHARSLLQQLGREDTVAAFRQFIHSFHYELETGCLMLARTRHPDCDPGNVCAFLDKMGRRCRELMVLPASITEKLRTINRVLFHEFGFRGDIEDFYNPENSFIHRVIDRRKGIPITLAVIYLVVAQRCQISLEPVSVPGRFMLAHFDGPVPLYIDCFEGGLVRTAEEVAEGWLPAGQQHEPGILSPCPIGEVLARCCRNLAHQYDRLGEERLSALYASFVDDFAEAHRRHA